MSQAEAPVDTEARQILAELQEQGMRIETLKDAVNSLGANVQWIIDNVKGIFEMFHNPMFGSMMSGMMAGGPPDLEAMQDAMTDMEDSGDGQADGE